MNSAQQLSQTIAPACFPAIASFPCFACIRTAHETAARLGEPADADARRAQGALRAMIPLGLSANALGQAIGVAGNRISEIVRGRRDVSADTAIRLGKYFNIDPRFWLNLESAYDLSLAENENDYSGVRPRVEAA